jgi:hypothetical protein
MKRTYLIITALFGTSCMLNAQQTTGVIADNLKIERNGEYMVVDMNMNLSRLDVESNRAVLLTPRFISTVDTLELPSVGVYGRQRYYYYGMVRVCYPAKMKCFLKHVRNLKV